MFPYVQHVTPRAIIFKKKKHGEDLQGDATYQLWRFGFQ